MLSFSHVLAGALTLAASSAYATHTIAIHNQCAWAVTLLVSNYPASNGVDYTGSASIDVGAGAYYDVSIPNGWEGRICDTPPGSGCSNNCFGGIAFGEAACSMAEFTFDSGGLNYYDLSNIQGYSVPMMINPQDGSCDTVMCQEEDCACNEAYRPGDTSGTCGGTGPVDQAVRACGTANYNLIFCP